MSFEAFFALSKTSYERRRLSWTLKYGTPRLAEIDDLAAVAEALQGKGCAITYLWGSDAESMQGVKTIQLLWQDT